MTILFVNLSSQASQVTMLLRGLECDVTSSPTTHQALELIRKKTFDAILVQEAKAERRTIDFAIDTYRTRPEIPVFLMKDWVQT